MALFLTALTFDGLDRFLDTHAGPGPICVITNASRALSDQPAIVAMATDALTAAGRTAHSMDVLTDATALEGAGAIVMAGGDPFQLRADLDTSGAAPLLQEAHRRGVPIIGQSAGAIVCGPRLEPIRLTSPFAAPDDAVLSGLSLTERLVLPHHGRPGRNTLHREAARAHGNELTLTPLWDDEVLVCDAMGWEIACGAWRTRAARSADAPVIGEVFRQATLAGWASFLGHDRLASHRHDDGVWAERITSAGDGFLVTEGEAGIAAFVSWRRHDVDTGELDLLYTHPRSWGAGLGRRLLERATWHLLCEGYREAVLWTEARNERALAVYRANGWIQDGAVDERSYAGAPIRNLRHRLDLTRHAGGR